ncbi:Y-family DNA polymerase [Moraxella sp. FZLJ2107]|uniref:Y-family DNA polymerase n=1 Tax=unclassified Moraxella TaxID=2685852 RepID=UPI0020C8BA6A|nr:MULTISPECIES: Y-family DNA polymerase [unclassified Moraxella]UTO05441.1 Y-family DNA polymerase [Moraxella sp. FZLJ2107]UTO22177.1 Y-family DNA polymerase [Moraxella sp. FZLJ2109]
MYALIDGNSFYCSCERIFNPKLKNKAVVVLSNNDGCVVARTAEAKVLGIKMGVPYFQIKDLVNRGAVIAFSSNYELYGDISARMMNTIASLVPAVEIYSIDECFADLTGINQADLLKLGKEIKNRVWQWVGIPTCVGIAPTKTLAKFCNHLAKSYPQHFGGVVVWNDWSKDIQDRALASQSVDEIWGIGSQTALQLKQLGINTAKDFVDADRHLIAHHFNVVTQRTWQEMNGKSCAGLEIEEPKKHIIRSRSFAKAITEIEPLQSAIAYHIASGAQKLREQNTLAHTLTVIIRTNPFGNHQQYYGKKTIVLTKGSNDTRVLNQHAQKLLKILYKQGYHYKKCGIELGGIEPIHRVQYDLFAKQDEFEHLENQHLMQTLDAINKQFGKGKLILGSQKLSDDWQMNRGFMSQRFTTRWDELLLLPDVR